MSIPPLFYADGSPGRVRIYDNNGRTLDRYTIVLTGPFPGRREGGMFISSAANPNDVYIVDTSNQVIDRPRYNHLGRKITWKDLPERVQKRAMFTYRALWRLDNGSAYY